MPGRWNPHRVGSRYTKHSYALRIAHKEHSPRPEVATQTWTMNFPAMTTEDWKDLANVLLMHQDLRTLAQLQGRKLWYWLGLNYPNRGSRSDVHWFNKNKEIHFLHISVCETRFIPTTWTRLLFWVSKRSVDNETWIERKHFISFYSKMSAKSGKDKKLPSKALDWASKNSSCIFGNVWELLAEDRIVMERQVE